MDLGAFVRDTLRRFGVEVRRFGPQASSLARRMTLLRRAGVDLVLDVGANRGQYGAELRRYGYRERIVSFEPLPGPFAILSKRIARDPKWTAENLALGDDGGIRGMHVSWNTASSSFLPILDRHLSVAPETRYTGTAEVRLEALDNLWTAIRGDAKHPFLKLDVQGYEGRVLRGARLALREMVGIQVELSLVPLYADSDVAEDMVSTLRREGYELMSFESGLIDPSTGQMLQCDGVFFRPTAFASMRVDRYAGNSKPESRN